MEINNQHLSINANKQKINAHSMSEKCSENNEQVQESGKSLNFTGLRNMAIRNLSLSAIKESIADNRPFAKSLDENFREAYENTFSDFSEKVKLSDLVKIAKENNLKVKSKYFLLDLLERAESFVSRQEELVKSNILKPEEVKKDSPEVILDLFKRVKNPTDTHRDFIDYSYLSVTDVNRCFNACGDNALKLKTLKYVRQDIEMTFNRNHNAHMSKEADKIFMDFVNSPNIDEYLTNYKTTYKGYISNGIRNKDYNVIKNMDNLYKNKTLVNVGDMKKLEKACNSLSEKAEGKINIEQFMPYQTAAGDELLEVLSTKFKPTKEYIEKSGIDDYVEIYKTATKDNLQLRSDFIDEIYSDTNSQSNNTIDEIQKLNKLFQIIDNNSSAGKFVRKVMNSDIQIHSAGELVELFEKHNPKTINLHSKRILNIMAENNNESYAEKVSDYLDNAASNIGKKISEILGNIFEKEPASIGKIISFPKRKKPKYVYPEKYILKAANNGVNEGVNEVNNGVNHVLPEINKVTPEVRTTEPLPELSELPKITNIKPEVTEIEEVQPLITEEVKETAKPKRKPFSLAESNKEKLMDIMTNSPSNTISKKLKIRENQISPVLKKYIKSEKLMNEQEYIYTVKATKMRANMLPDIFESIKITRAEAKKANGGKLPKDFTCNEDALDLYTRINGKNKKLVEYMLKQTKKDENGKTVRAFNVKEIIEKVDNLNYENTKAKKLATKENPFTSKNEKAVFDNALADLKSEYGELKKTKVKKNK